jgi:hypothetical protein
MLDKTKVTDIVTADVAKGAAVGDGMAMGGVYTVECFDANGNLKWSDSFHNLVTIVGLQDVNNKYFTGSAYTAVWYVGLIVAGGTYAYADTAASHAGWTESTAYSQATRPALTFGASTSANPSVISTSAASVFSMNGAATIGGAFVISNNTKGGTTGILFSEGNFTGGSKTVASGDTLNVSYSLSNAG